MRRYRAQRLYAWSPAIAYSVGLIASDGCLQKDGRHIDLTSVDIEQLHNFSKAIGRELRITLKHKQSPQLAYRVQFGDVAYYDFLLAAGLTPSKSKTIGDLNIPNRFYADFLRGLFDGDGSCYGYTDPRWRSSFMFYTCFTTASLDFARYLQRTNSRLIGVSLGSIKKSKRAYTVAYAKANSHKLYHYMYYDKDCIGLTRKRTKLFEFTQKDRGGMIIASL